MFEQVQAYHARIAAILHGDRDLSQADMPRVLTVDSSQGDEVGDVDL